MYFREIRQRLQFLCQVGLGYLQLNRESGTLSGGEAQRIRLATQIGSGLSGVMYVLDEPSIGLHQRDNDRLIRTLRDLRDLGNSVIVVERDEDTIRAADRILDLARSRAARGEVGRRGASGGGSEMRGVAHRSISEGGNPDSCAPRPGVPAQDRSGSGDVGDGWLRVHGASENNLKDVTASFPAGCLTCVTGVSGSGKSTLVNDILRPALERDLNRAKSPGQTPFHLRHRAV